MTIPPDSTSSASFLTAAMTEPPSRSAISFSRASMVGFPVLLYSYPLIRPRPSCLNADVWWIGTLTAPVLSSIGMPLWIADVAMSLNPVISIPCRLVHACLSYFRLFRYGVVSQDARTWLLRGNAAGRRERRSPSGRNGSMQESEKKRKGQASGASECLEEECSSSVSIV